MTIIRSICAVDILTVIHIARDVILILKQLCTSDGGIYHLGTPACGGNPSSTFQMDISFPYSVFVSLLGSLILAIQAIVMIILWSSASRWPVKVKSLGK